MSTSRRARLFPVRVARSVLGLAVLAAAAAPSALGAQTPAYAAGSPVVVGGTSAATGSTTAGPAMRAVTDGGVTLQVPATWPVVALASQPGACVRFDVHAVYIGHQRTQASCPANGVGRTEAVQLETLTPAARAHLRQALVSAVVDGVGVFEEAGATTRHAFVLAVPNAGVVVRVSWGQNQSLAAQIVQSLKVSATPAPLPGAVSAQSVASPPAVPVPVAPLATPATAAPSTTTASPLATWNGPSTANGFDTCAAPSLAAMNAWLASPYRTAGVYIGGANRACGDGNLSASWVQSVVSRGWKVLPLYVGLQSPCVYQPGLATINASLAAQQGAAAAADAVTQARSFGLGTGSAIYFDMEAYGGSAGCTQATDTFLSAWTVQLHKLGYVSGVYGSSGSTINNLLAPGIAVPGLTMPDAIDFAEWNNVQTTASSVIPASAWTGNQRIHQYNGNLTQTYGGATLNLDGDYINAPLAPATASPTPTPAPTPAPTPTPTPTPAPAAPSPSASRPASAINTNGTSEVFVISGGQLLHSYQCSSCAGGWSGWSAVVAGSTFTGSPVVGQNADGRLEVFARQTNGLLVHTYQAAPSSGPWIWGGALMAQPIASSPAVGRWGNGRLEVFAVTSGGSLVHVWQDGPNGSGGGWSGPAVMGSGLAPRQLAVAMNVNGSMEIFGLTTGGALAHVWLDTATNSWSPLSPLAGTGLVGAPAVARNADGRLEVFARQANGAIFHAWQPAPAAGPWSSASLGGAVTSGPAILQWPNGRLELFVGGPSNTVEHLWQLVANGATGWSGWATLGGSASGRPGVVASGSSAPGVVATAVGGGPIEQQWLAGDSPAQWSAWNPLG